MGLPHVLVRFYTNPDGAAARRTTLVVLGLVGLFYLLPTMYGVLGRVYTPQLLLTGDTDAVVLLLPGAALGGLTGQLLGALVAAGAFAAFLSTSSGLLTSIAGVVSTDVLGRGSVRDFRLSAVVGRAGPARAGAARGRAGRVPGGRARLRGRRVQLLPAAGTGHLVAGADRRRARRPGYWSAAAPRWCAVVATVAGPPLTGWPAILVGQPAAWTVPLAFLVMVVASMLTRRRVPRDVGTTMLRLHAPDALRL